MTHEELEAKCRKLEKENEKLRAIAKLNEKFIGSVKSLMDELSADEFNIITKDLKE